jgi:hypothetical protein
MKVGKRAQLSQIMTVLLIKEEAEVAVADAACCLSSAVVLPRPLSFLGRCPSSAVVLLSSSGRHCAAHAECASMRAYRERDG